MTEAEYKDLPPFIALFMGSNHAGLLIHAHDSQTARQKAKELAKEWGLSGHIIPYKNDSYKDNKRII